MNFIVIGLTDHPNPSLTPEIREIITDHLLFSGGRRHHDIVGRMLPPKAAWIDITVPIDHVFDEFREQTARHGCDTIVVFASGDPLFFGFANTIKRKMPDAAIRLFPAFNSLQMLAHRIIMPYHDIHIVSLTGRPWQELDRALIEAHHKIGVLTDREHSPAAIAERMLQYGYTGYQMTVGEHLGHPEKERITSLTLQEACQRPFDYPNCLILTGHHQHRVGLPDNEFALLDGRNNMITKMPIRLLTLQAMELCRRTAMWDIGFCTGSVSIESRLQYPHLNITAFEIRPECEAIISENARRFGAPGIRTVMGDFLTADLSDVTKPDAVFIGGHGGRLKEIMHRIDGVMDSGGCIVMNSVTPQSREMFEDACGELHWQLQQATHIAINQYHPIDILKCVKP